MKPKELKGLVDQVINLDHLKEWMQENTKMPFPAPSQFACCKMKENVGEKVMPFALTGEVFDVEYIIEETDFSEERLNQLVYWVLSEGKEV